MKNQFVRRLTIGFSIIAGAIIIAAASGYYFVGAMDANVKSILSDRSKGVSQANSVNLLSTLKDQAPQAAAYQSALEGILPTQDGLIGFGQWLNSAAAAHSVTVTFAFQGQGTPPNGGNPGQIPLTLQATGSMDNLAAFLQDVESGSAAFLVNIVSFNLTNSGAAYQLNGQAITFFRP